MIKLNKIDKFIKNNIRSFRAKAIPLLLDDKSIAVGNSLIKRINSQVTLNDPRNDKLLNLNFVYSAVLLAKYIDRGHTPNSNIWNKIVDLDRKLIKYKSEQEFYENKLKKTNNDYKIQLYSCRMDQCNREYDIALEELNRLNKWAV